MIPSFATSGPGPRANVLFEYGYLSAMLTRGRVALCRYTTAELPSDFAGMTDVPMGPFEITKPLDAQARARLKSWATELPVYEVYRRLPLQSPDYAVINGRMLLQIPPDGKGGSGALYGTMQVQIGACYAEFEICELVVEARIQATEA